MIKRLKADAEEFVRLLRNALSELLQNDPLRMAGATAFFTTFALPPILVILIQSLKLILDPEKVRSQLFESLSGIVGPEAVEQIKNVLNSLRELAENRWVLVGGFIFLLFIATTLFRVIKSSINQIWKIRPVKKLSLVKTLRARLKSIIVILVAGILFVIGLVAEGVRAFIGDYIFEISPLLSFYFNSVFTYVISIGVVTVWFAIVFRFLPDGRPKWKTAFAGALLTALLFTLGKIILHWLLSYSNINTVYGTSASIVLLLLFVFYSSLILYYGAAFTKVWGQKHGHPVRPLPHAMRYRLIEASLEK
jgi:membrane protein